LRRDLHDGLGPTLAAIRLKARLAAREVPAGSAAEALLAEIATEAAASVADVRRLVEALRPPALDELGLVAAVRSRADALAGAVTIEVRGDVTGNAAGSGAGRGDGTGESSDDTSDESSDGAGEDGAPVPLPAAVETAAYRIAVEAMTNVVRHSGATTCTVRIQRHPDAVEVTVSDNGRGLDPARPSGVGLRSMRERAAELGGELSLGVADEGGTLVRAHLPLAPRGRTA
jgi:signal transduction histidine kinase